MGNCRGLGKLKRPVHALSPVMILVIVGATAWGANAKKSPEVPALFIFGDSLADTGTNDYIPGSSYPPLPLANIVPYGESFFPVPTGRWCNGRLVFDFIAEYLKLPFPEPFLKPGAKFGRGACFASAGSGILDATFAATEIIPLSKQLKQFQQLVTELKEDVGNDKADYILSKSLYAFVSGSNDISAYISNSTLVQTITPEEYIGTVISKLGADILVRLVSRVVTQTIIGIGARKIVIDGMEPQGCSPVILAASNSTGACVESVNELDRAFDSALLELVTGLNAKMNATVVIVSTTRYNTELDLILNGASEGFTEGPTGCCGSGPFNGNAYSCGRGNYTLCSDVSKYVRWDFIHPTERVNHILAHKMWNGNKTDIQPVNIHELSCL